MGNQITVEYVDDTKFPRDVRATVNDVVDWMKGKWEVKFTADLNPNAAKVIVSDNGVIILIPRGAIVNGLLPFGLLVTGVDTIRVVFSTIGGRLPTGFHINDDPQFVITIASASGYIFAQVTYDKTTGVISSRDIKQSATAPVDDDTHTNAILGTFSNTTGKLIALNTGYGPCVTNACRDFYNPDLPYSVSLTAANTYIFTQPPPPPSP